MAMGEKPVEWTDRIGGPDFLIAMSARKVGERGCVLELWAIYPPQAAIKSLAKLLTITPEGTLIRLDCDRVPALQTDAKGRILLLDEDSEQTPPTPS